MTVILEMLSEPFMQRAFAAGLLLAVLLGSLGIFVTLRKMAFFGDGIAHASLAGIAAALLLGWTPLPVALGWAVLVAVAIHALERSTRLPSDTLIGIFFTASMALGVAMMSFTHGFQPELVTYLFGSILAVRPEDLMIITGVGLVILGWVYFNFRALTYASLAPENAAVSGIAVSRQSLALYVALAIATVLGVKVLGIVLVSALLVLPPATSRMLTSTFRGYVGAAIAVALLTTTLGLTASYLYDLPSGAAIILAGALTFFVAAGAKRLVR
ncbi:MAG: hypothetical protein RLZZ324_237 [Candidatus Parcubacteria bacterium]|jgi:zinc transport system permease protein